MTELNSSTCKNITSSLNTLTAKWEYIVNLAGMSKFIIEKHQSEMPEEAVNWLYGNMNLIEEMNLFDEVEGIARQLTNHNNHSTASSLGLGEEIVFNDNDLPF